MAAWGVAAAFFSRKLAGGVLVAGGDRAGASLIVAIQHDKMVAFMVKRIISAGHFCHRQELFFGNILTIVPFAIEVFRAHNLIGTSNPADIMICLYNCGLWLRNASFSK